MNKCSWPFHHATVQNRQHLWLYPSMIVITVPPHHWYFHWGQTRASTSSFNGYVIVLILHQRGMGKMSYYKYSCMPIFPPEAPKAQNHVSRAIALTWSRQYLSLGPPCSGPIHVISPVETKYNTSLARYEVWSPGNAGSDGIARKAEQEIKQNPLSNVLSKSVASGYMIFDYWHHLWWFYGNPDSSWKYKIARESKKGS